MENIVLSHKKWAIKYLVILVLVFIGFQKGLAADAQQVFENANRDYQAGNYRAAADGYESILRNGNIFSKELYFNLGNAYYRLNLIGLSMLNYERALRLAPSDPEVQQNLNVARARVSDDIEPVATVFFVQWMYILRGSFPADTWAVFGLFFIWLGAAGFTVWLLGIQRTWKKRGFITGLVAIPLSILLFLLARGAARVMQTPFAIIIASETQLKTAPDPNAATVNTLHEGLKIELLDKFDTMTKVKLPNGEDGWLLSADVTKI